MKSDYKPNIDKKYFILAVVMLFTFLLLGFFYSYHSIQKNRVVDVSQLKHKLSIDQSCNLFDILGIAVEKSVLNTDTFNCYSTYKLKGDVFGYIYTHSASSIAGLVQEQNISLSIIPSNNANENDLIAYTAEKDNALRQFYELIEIISADQYGKNFRKLDSNKIKGKELYETEVYHLKIEEIEIRKGVTLLQAHFITK